MSARTANPFRRVADWLYYSECYMAVSAALLAYLCAGWLGRPLDLHWYVVAFTGCWWVYVLDAGLMGIPEEDHINTPARVAFIRSRRKPLSVVLAVVTIASLVSLALHPPHGATWALIGVCAAIGGAYICAVIPLPGRRRTRLKELALAKPLIITLTWLGGAMGLPMLEGANDGVAAAPIPLIAALLGVMLLADAIASDWLDRRGDRQQDIRTLAVRLTPKRFTALMILLAAFTLILWLIGLLFAVSASWWTIGGATLLAFALGLYATTRPNLPSPAAALAMSAWRFTAAGALALTSIQS